MKSYHKKILILLILIALFAAIKFFGLDQYFTFANLQLYKEQLTHFVAENYLLASVIFVLVYYCDYEI